MSSDPLLGFDAFVDYSDADKANQAAAAATAAALLASPNTLDFFSFNPTDVLAPHPDLFESELDSSLSQIDDSQLSLSFLDVDAPADPFAFFRSDTPTHAYRSTPSVVTASSASESASGYDSLSSYSESFYNAANSPDLSLAANPTDFAFTLDGLNMDFHRIGLDHRTGYAASAMAARTSPIMPNAGAVGELAHALGEDRTSFGALPASSPRGDSYRARSRSGAYSDYAPSHRVVPSSAASDYYPTLTHARHPSLVGIPTRPPSNAQRTVSPASLSPSSQSGQSDMMPITPPLPIAPVATRVQEAQEDDEQDGPADARRKYKCPTCPRAFARAFNLKTHLATHDPNRPKPHVCPHKACGRSFSRKHDLGRHLVSIHRDEQGIPTGSVTVAAAGGHTAHHARSTNGSERGGSASAGPARSWCNRCGKAWNGRDRNCACAINDIK